MPTRPLMFMNRRNLLGPNFGRHAGAPGVVSKARTGTGQGQMFSALAGYTGGEAGCELPECAEAYRVNPIFLDTFSGEASDVTLENHTPDVGGPWLNESIMNAVPYVDSFNDKAYANGSGTGLDICMADLGSILSQPRRVEMKLESTLTGKLQHYNGLIVRGTEGINGKMDGYICYLNYAPNTGNAKVGISKVDDAIPLISSPVESSTVSIGTGGFAQSDIIVVDDGSSITVTSSLDAGLTVSLNTTDFNDAGTHSKVGIILSNNLAFKADDYQVFT